MTLGICKLCGDEKELQRSHVIGKTVFSKILKESIGNYLVDISVNNQKISKSNDTWDSKLLCKECESFFNRKYENYSVYVLRKKQNGVQTIEGNHGIYFRNVDQSRIILYLCSIYWRAAHSTHKAYEGVRITNELSHYLAYVFKGKFNLNAKVFSARIRLIADESKTFTDDRIKMIVSPYFRFKGKGFVFCMAYEGYFFELFFNASNFKERQQPGFLNKAISSFFVPKVDLIDLPAIAMNLAQGIEIHQALPDEEKIKILRAREV
ncbi:hypothetical protein IIQ43_12515 [Acinetobacter oleivorans]|uniref:HNH endonuclease n=1 Tax=Acinetobacter oleivorans TaxID=1148157 RepID=A0ABR9NK90_9GAMM|nr:hypothetical protein [Acinetobacter oleivorans]MBE2165347.1 hypothetical protein [Acinetobacter oleivorans]